MQNDKMEMSVIQLFTWLSSSLINKRVYFSSIWTQNTHFICDHFGCGSHVLTKPIRLVNSTFSLYIRLHRKIHFTVFCCWKIATFDFLFTGYQTCCCLNNLIYIRFSFWNRDLTQVFFLCTSEKKDKKQKECIHILFSFIIIVINK